MSTLLIAAIVLAAPADDSLAAEKGSTSVVASGPEAPAPLTGPKLREAVRGALRRWARVDEKGADAAAREFLALYGQLHRDDRLVQWQREELRLKVRGRLIGLSRLISQRVAKAHAAKAAAPKSVDAAAGKKRVLAQRGGFPARGGFGPGQFGPGGFGGPAFGGLGNPMQGQGGAGVNDYGDQLVDLIQTTIAPGSWDVNGGPGTIYYWQPGHALVIRQTGDGHRQIGGALQQLRRLGP